VRQLGEDSYDAIVGATMLLTTLSLLHVVAALSARDEHGTIFSRENIPGGSQLRLYGLALILTVLVTEIGFFQRIFVTTSLTGNQWLVCIVFALVLLAVEEAAKFVLARRGDEAQSMADPTPGDSAEPATN
jgi:Ca2+-transporting ATPase